MLIFSLVFLQVIIFVAMIVVLKKIMTTNVTMATKHIEEMSQDYLKKEAMVEKQLEEARQKSEDMVAKASQEAEEVKVKKLEAANTESASILDNARVKGEEMIQQADRARERLMAEIDEKIADGAISKAVELIHDTLPENFLKDIHSQWADELIENGFSKVERLNMPKDIKEIRIVSAFELGQDQRKSLVSKLKDVLKYEVPVKEQTDPKIVAGIVLHVGSLVLDGSLRSKIREKAINAKHAGS